MITIGYICIVFSFLSLLMLSFEGSRRHSIFLRPFSLPSAYLFLQYCLFPFFALSLNLQRREIPKDDAYIYGIILTTTFILIFTYFAIKIRQIKMKLFYHKFLNGREIYVIGAAFFTIGLFSFFKIMDIAGGIFNYLLLSGYYRSGGLVGNGHLIFAVNNFLPLSSLIMITFPPRSKGVVYKLFCLGYILIALSCMIVIGYRSSLLFFIIELIIILQFRGVFSKVFLNIFSIVIFALIVIWGIIRDAGNSIENTIDSFSNSFLESLTRFNSTEVISVLIREYGSISDLKLGIYNLSLILTSFVPRVVFPDKPEPYSVTFTEDVMKQFFPSGANVSGVAPSVVGDALWNFGPIGILIYMLPLIFILALLKGAYNAALSGNEISQLYTAKIVTFLIFFLEAPVIATNGFIPTVVILLSLHFLCYVSCNR